MSYLTDNVTAPVAPSRLMANLRGGADPDQAALDAAYLSNPFEAGAKSAIRSSIGGMKGLAAGVQAAYGGDPTDMYAAAQRDAELAAAIGPKVRSLSDIHGLEDATGYALGQMGSMAPFVVAGATGGVAGRGLNRALGAGMAPEVAAHAGSMGAFVPSMAGEQLMQMHEAAPDMDPREALARAVGVGGLQAAAGAAIPNALLRAPAAQPFWQGLGKQIAAGSAGMTGMDVIGQTHRGSYDPTYQYNPEQTLESAVAGGIGMAPLAVPHAALGAAGKGAKVAGKGTAAATDTFVGGLKDAAKAAYDMAPDALKDHLDTLGTSAQDVAAGVAALKPYMQAAGDALAGHASDAMGNAKQAVADYNASADVGVDRGERLINLASDLYGTGVRATSEAVGTMEGLAAEAAKDPNLPHPVSAVMDKLTRGSAAPDEVLDILADPSKWVARGGKLTPQEVSAIENLRGNPAAIKAATGNILRTMDEQGATGPRAEELRGLIQKVNDGGNLSPQESADLWATAKFMRKYSDVAGTLDAAMQIGKKFQITKNADGSGTVENLSRQRDTVNKAVREALKNAGASQRLVDRIASRIQTADVLGGDITRTVRDAVSEGIKSYGVDPKADQTYTHLYDEVLSTVQERVAKLKEEGVIKEPVSENTPMSDAFKSEVRDAMHTMFEGSDLGRELIDAGKSESYADNMADFAHKLARGEVSAREANTRRQAMEHAFGEDGVAAMDRIVAAAKHEFGNGREGDRIDNLMNTSRSMAQAAGEARSLMVQRNETRSDIKNAVTGETFKARAAVSLKPYVDLLNNAKQFDADHGQLDNIIQAKQVQADNAPAGSNRRYELNRQIEQLESLRGKTGFGLLRDELVGKQIVSAKNFERFIAALERYAGHEDQITRPEKRVVSESKAANHAAEKEDDFDNPEVKQDAATPKSGDEGDEVQNFLHQRFNENTGADSVVSGKPVEFVGTSAFNEGKVKGNPGAPLSKHASGDQSDRVNINGNEFGNAVTAWHTKYGDRQVQARGVSVPEWAEEMAATSGKTAREHMNDAMKALLAHDKERAQSGSLEPADRTFIEARAKLAASLGDSVSAGERFFSSPMNKAFRYYRIEPSDGANLRTYSTHDLEGRFGIHGDTGYWVEKMSRLNPQFPKSVFENSVLTLEGQQGEVRVDFPRMVMEAMARHQEGDISGVGEKNVKPDLMEAMKTAVMNVMSTLMISDGITPESLMSALEVHGNRLGKGRDITSNIHFNPNLVVFRDPTGQVMQSLGEHVSSRSVKRVFTMGDVTKVVGTDFVGNTLRAEPGPRIGKEELGNFVKPSSGKSSSKLLVADAERGVARNGATVDGKSANVDAHAVMRRALERAGIDPTEAMNGELPKTLAAKLFVEAMRDLQQHGVNGDFVKFYEGMFSPSVMYDNVVLFHTRYGDGERYPVTVGDLRKFKDGSVGPEGEGRVNLFTLKKDVPTNLRDAKAAEDAAYGKQLEANERALNKRLATRTASERDRAAGAAQDAAMAIDRESRDSEVHITEKNGKKIRYAVDKPDPALKYDASETENFRIGSSLKEYGEAAYGDTPLFDKSAEQLMLDADRKEAAGSSRRRINARSEWEASASPEEKVALAKQRARDLEDDFAAAKKEQAASVAEREALNAPLQQKRVEINTKVESNRVSGEATQPKPLTLAEQRANAKLQSIDVKTNKQDLETHAFRETSREVQRQRNAAAEAAKIDVSSHAASTAPMPPADIAGRVSAKTEPIMEAPTATGASGSDMAKRFAGEASDLAKFATSVNEVRALSDGELKNLLLNLPRLGEKPGTVADALVKRLSNKSGTLSDIAEKIEARTGLKWNGKQFVEAGDAPFSRQRTVDQSAAGAPSREELQAAKQRLFGEAFGFDMKDALTDKAGREVSGKFDEKDMNAIVSALASDRMGTLYHEGWHGIEKLLGDMGENGKAILDSVYKHVSSPQVREWLEQHYAGDEDLLSQLESPRERAAFAFQAVASGEKIPGLAPEARSTLQKVIDWARQMAAKMGITLTTAEERTNNFFQYVKDGGFARDFENSASLREALGEGNGDNVIRTAAKTMKPVMEAFDKVFQHTSARIEELGIKEYADILHAFEGETGKGGIHLDQHRWATKFANEVGDMLHSLTAEQREEFIHQKNGAYAKWSQRVVQYLDKALADGGVPPKEKSYVIDNFFKRVGSFNGENINKNFEAFVTDLTKFGGEGVQGKAGRAREIANEIADKGFFYDPEITLFADRPDIMAKWRERDPLERANRMIDVATRIAERARRFGYKDEKLNKLIEAGDAKADKAGKQLIRDFVDAVDGTLGNDMSPGMKKLQGNLLFVQNVHALPLAVFSQMLEPMQLALRRNRLAGSLDSLFRGVKDLPRTFEAVNKTVAPDYWEKLSYQVGSAPTRIVQGVMTNLMNGMHLQGRARKWNDAFFRYNFMEQWNRSMHVEATKHAVEYLKENARGLNGEHSERFLKDLGVTKDEILSAIKTVEDNGKQYETLQLTDNIEQAIVQFVEEAMAHPNAGSNAMWMNDPRFALLAQMKRFTFSHSKYVLDRGIKEMKLGNAFPVAPAIIAMPWMMAADGLRDTLSMKQHAERANWSAWDYAKHSFERAGHPGRGQFVTDAMNAVGRGQSPVEALGGPTVEMFGDLARGAHNGHMIDKLFEYIPGSAAIPAF